MSGLLTTREVAERLGVTTATVLNWTHAGELPGIRLPSGQLRYPADRFEEWLAARATPGGHVTTRNPQPDAALAAPPPERAGTMCRATRRSLQAVTTTNEDAK